MAKINVETSSLNFTALATGGAFIAGAATLPGLPPWLAIILGIIGYGLTAVGGTVEEDGEEPPKSGREARDRFINRSIVLSALLVPLFAFSLGCGGWALGSITHEASGASVSVEGDEIEVDAISVLRVCLERGRFELCEEIRPSVYWLRSEGVLYLCASNRLIPSESACVPIPVGEGDAQ